MVFAEIVRVADEVRIGVTALFTTKNYRRSRAEHWYDRAQTEAAKSKGHRLDGTRYRIMLNRSKIWSRYRGRFAQNESVA